jgi:hypothetical protein
MMPPPAPRGGGAPGGAGGPRAPDALADAAVQGTNDDATVSKLCVHALRTLHARTARSAAAARA